MDFFANLESLISSQQPSHPSAAAVLADLGSPSVSIALLDHGSVTSHCISTISDNTETLFQACSISKPIAGLATMRLIQAGRLQLDSKIVDLLPEHVISILGTEQTRELLTEITVTHLLSHTSGLNISHFSGYTRNAPDLATVLSGTAPANTVQVKIQGFPGYALSYSGGGMVVLQLVLEAVTGKAFPALVKELVFDPLGMTRSYYSFPEQEKNVAKAYLTGYSPCDVPWHDIPEMAAAGLWTTPTDLLKAVRGIQASLKGDGDEVLEKQIAEEMLKEVKGTMALTWIVPHEGTAFVHAGENDPGWRCFVMGYADLKGGNGGNGMEKRAWDDCGICIMTNSAAGFTVWAKVFHAITYLKGWASLPNVIGGGPLGKIPFCVRGVEIDERWTEWKGCWLDDKAEFVLESNEENEPVLRFGDIMTTKILPAAMPSIEFAGQGKSIELVLAGLEMMIRLGWKDGNRGIELWYDGVPPKLAHLSSLDGGTSI